MTIITTPDHNRDVRPGVLQVKIGDLRAPLSPSSNIIAELIEVGGALSERSEGATREGLSAVGRIVAGRFGLATVKLKRVYADSQAFPPPSSQQDFTTTCRRSQ
jgi:hypothetical protein